LTRWLIALVVVGVGWRTFRYLLQLPIWGDEAFVALNLLDRGYLDLLKPLRFAQVAPVLFMWSELTVFRTLGGSELALRLLPFVAGLASLAVFWKFLKVVGVGRLPAVLALGILSVSYYPVRHSCEIKPYSLDLLMSLCLLLAAARWLAEPDRLRRLLALVILVPLVLALSYPAVFVAGAVSIALLPTVFRRTGWQVRAVYLLYNIAMGGTFLGIYCVVGRGQFTSTGGSANPFWEMWFPPSQPWPLAKWLIAVHTGNLFAYPFGGHDGGSTLTLVLCLIGAYALAQSRRWSLLLLCTSPFALTFVAAAMHRYPYGGSARVAQHLAPTICLLAACGAAASIVWPPRLGVAPRTAAVTLLAGLAVIGVIGIARDVIKPYKTDGDRQVRQIIRDIVADSDPGDEIVAADPHRSIGPTSEWYLRRLGGRVRWDGRIDRDMTSAQRRQLWLMRFGESGSSDASIAQMQRQAPSWILLERTAYTLQLGWSDATIEHCEVLHWARADNPAAR
jgi:hypothetical protein